MAIFPTAADHALIALALFGHFGLGRAVLGNRDWGVSLVAGLLLTGCVGALLAWTAAGLVVPVARTLTGTGIGLGIWLVYRNTGSGRAAPSARIALPVLAVSAVYFMAFHSEYNLYNSEDMSYFGPFVEFFLADYNAPVRVPTYWPAQMAGMHLVPFTALAALCSFVGHATATHAALARYAAIVAVTTLAFVRLWPRNTTARQHALFAAAALCCLALFGAELSSTLVGSTYLFVLTTIMMVALGLTANGDEDGLDRRALLFLVIGAVATKLTIFFVPAAAALFTFACFKRQRFNPAILLIGTLALANIAIIATAVIPFPDIDMSFSLANPFSSKPSIDYFSHWHDGLIDKGRFGALFSNPYLAGVVAAVAVAAVKTCILPMAAVDGLRAKAADRGALRVVEVYVLVLVAGWVVVRNSQWNTTHQAWLLFVGVLVPLLAIPRWMALSDAAWPTKRLLPALAVTAAVYAALGPTPAREGLERWRRGDALMVAGLTREEWRRFDQAAVLTRRDGEPAVNVGLRSLLAGVRLPAATTPLEYSGAASNWIVLGTEMRDTR